MLGTATFLYLDFFFLKNIQSVIRLYMLTLDIIIIFSVTMINLEVKFNAYINNITTKSIARKKYARKHCKEDSTL